MLTAFFNLNIFLVLLKSFNLKRFSSSFWIKTMKIIENQYRKAKL